MDTLQFDLPPTMTDMFIKRMLEGSVSKTLMEITLIVEFHMMMMVAVFLIILCNFF